MGSSGHIPLWWDRETDDQTGVQLRPDVRESAHRIWRWVLFKAQEMLGDSSDAADVLEVSVRTVSRYLDKNNLILHSADPTGLLIVSAYRALQRVAKKRRRFELVGPTNDLAEALRAPDWRHEVDHRIFLKELAGQLEPTTRGLLRLRLAGYDWKEIAKMVGLTPDAVRMRFWRDVRKAHLRLLRTAKRVDY